MGVVFQAVDPTIGRTVAIKTIRLGDVTNSQERAKLRERLFREARSAGILSHPNIVTIYDMQEEDDMAYIAMEYVDGPTLDALMSSAEPVRKEEVLRILRQTASGLDYAHQKGIVHRDIKPANIMLDKAGQVKITDFGIAKVSSSEQFTMTGTIVGTPNYMSPEQVQGLPTIDGRSDQFSLSVIAFEMLTGEKPFSGEHLTTVVYKIVAGDPIPPRRLNPTLGAEIEAVLHKALAKQPDARFLSCIEFVNALERACASTKGWTNLARGGSQDMPTMGVDQPMAAVPGRPALPPPAKRARVGDTTMRQEKRRMSALTVVLAILVATGLVGLIAWQAAPWLIDSGKQESAQPAVPAKPAPPAQTAQAASPASREAESRHAVITVRAGRRGEAHRNHSAAGARRDSQNRSGRACAGAAQSQARRARAAARAGDFRCPAAGGRNHHHPLRRAGLARWPVSATSCRTPCTLTAPPGKHFIEITLPGYQTEHREIDSSGGPQDMPPITMRLVVGTLMLSSDPPGASISVNGKLQDKVTPAQLNLPPGSYNIALSKDGKTESRVVQIQNGSMKAMKIDFRAQ